MLRFSIIALIVAIAPLTAPAQTTQPAEKTAPAAAADQAWPRAVEALALALSSGDAAKAQTVLSTRATMRGFDSQQFVETGALLARLAKSTLVGQHAYLHPPMVMAADIGADFKNAATISDKAKARFIVDDDAEIKRANITAVRWVVDQIGARTGTPIGVIVLWTPRPAAAGSAETEPVIYDPIFVLCKGEEVAAREFKITSVVFGNPLPQGNP